MIDQQIVNKQISELSSKKIDQNNEMLVIQDQLLDVKVQNTSRKKFLLLILLRKDMI